MAVMVLLLSVARIRLNGACSAGESCLSDNAECLRGRCQCRPGFFDVAGDCGQQLSIILHALTYTIPHRLTCRAMRYTTVIVIVVRVKLKKKKKLVTGHFYNALL